MLTSATFQGGQDAAPDCGCKTPPSRLVLPPWFPTWPLMQRASWSGVRVEPSAAGYELAGHARPEQRGTALDRLRNAAFEIVGLSQRRTGRPSRRRHPRAGSACRQRARDGSSTPRIVDRPTSPLCIRRRMPISPLTTSPPYEPGDGHDGRCIDDVRAPATGRPEGRPSLDGLSGAGTRGDNLPSAPFCLNDPLSPA
jgi:hypothetical protein